jgi:hypothetical protein
MAPQSYLNYAPRPNHGFHRAYGTRREDGKWYGYPETNKLDDMFRHLSVKRDPNNPPERPQRPERGLDDDDDEEAYINRRPKPNIPKNAMTARVRDMKDNDDDDDNDPRVTNTARQVRRSSVSSGDLSPEPKPPFINMKGLYSSTTFSPFGEPVERELKLDPFGLPLEPQPLDDKDDPLSWSQRRKISVLILISLMSFLSQFLAMAIVRIPLPYPLPRFVLLRISLDNL